MSTKTRPKVPTWTRRRAVARRWFREVWGELRELRAEHAEASGKPLKAEATVRANPYRKCRSC